MADIVELDASEVWYKVTDSSERTWDMSLSGGILSIAVGYDKYTFSGSGTLYFGQLFALNPQTAEGTCTIYIPIDCNIRMAALTWSGNETSTEDISIYVRVNGATDYLIATVGNANATKFFNNTNLDIPLAAGNTIELKVVYPNWVDGPGTEAIIGGSLYAWFYEITMTGEVYIDEKIIAEVGDRTKYVVDWVSDSSTGNVVSDPIYMVGFLYEVETIPGANGDKTTNTPTNLYDITITDPYGYDLMNNKLANRSGSVAQRQIAANPMWVDDYVTINISNAAVNSRKFIERTPRLLVKQGFLCFR